LRPPSADRNNRRFRFASFLAAAFGGPQQQKVSLRELLAAAFGGPQQQKVSLRELLAAVRGAVTPQRSLLSRS
jgi:hypothetical protein